MSPAKWVFFPKRNPFISGRCSTVRAVWHPVVLVLLLPGADFLAIRCPELAGIKEGAATVVGNWMTLIQGVVFL